MGFKSIALAVSTLVLSTSVNASVIHTLNGIEYEWLEFSESQGLSRLQVEANIAAANPGDALYGYEYASRQLTEDLLLSYIPFGGDYGWNGASNTALGTAEFLADFGVTSSSNPITDVSSSYATVDGYNVTFESGNQLFGRFMFGQMDECDTDKSCIVFIQLARDTADNPAMTYIGTDGFDATFVSPSLYGDHRVDPDYASLLVRTSAVPVPAAAWLFGSGLLGLVGVARRKKS